MRSPAVPNLRALVAEGHAQGLSDRAIARVNDATRAAVTFQRRKLGLKPHKNPVTVCEVDEPILSVRAQDERSIAKRMVVEMRLPDTEWAGVCAKHGYTPAQGLALIKKHSLGRWLTGDARRKLSE